MSTCECEDLPCGCPPSEESARVFNEFWQEIVCDKRGRLSRKQIVKELHDYHTLLDHVPRVYMHITGGRISKPNTDADTVIAVATDCENETLAEVLADEKEAWKAEYLPRIKPRYVIDVDFTVLKTVRVYKE